MDSKVQLTEESDSSWLLVLAECKLLRSKDTDKETDVSGDQFKDKGDT